MKLQGQLLRSCKPVFGGQVYLKTLVSMSFIVISAKVVEILGKEMNCLKVGYLKSKYLMFGVWISWAHFLHHVVCVISW